MIDLNEVATALDAFPHLTENQRAEIFHAIDLAPEHPLSSWSEAKMYFDYSAAHLAWHRIREYNLGGTVTLYEAAGYESAPTADEILRSLMHGARITR